MTTNKLAELLLKKRAQQQTTQQFQPTVPTVPTVSKVSQTPKITTGSPVTTNKLAELIKARAHTKTIAAAPNPNDVNPFASSTDKYGNVISYNAAQQEFIKIASSGKSCILIGAAGTGKTTCMKGVATALVQSNNLPIMRESHKHLPVNTPGIVFCAYTRRAAANLRRNLPLDLQANCVTIHKLLEYEPVYNTVFDPDSGKEKTTMTFEPARHEGFPLSSDIKVVIFEESSMIGVELYKQVIAALPHNVQYIFLGDIQQLPPVFGAAILGYKLLELPTVELTEVYRQALESPIIKLAHRILSGKPIYPEEFDDWETKNKLKIHPWKKKIHEDLACMTFGKFITVAMDAGQYVPEEDIILIPFNKSFGTEETNKIIANHIARKNGRITYEVIAGFNKIYLSVGDKVLVDKEDAVITKIETNPSYSGARFQAPSAFLDYWGHNQNPQNKTSDSEYSEDEIDFLLEAAVTSDERVRQASHKIYLKRYDSSEEFHIETASEINNISLGYALTVHKSQGSEWRKVFLVFHSSHATMTQRELLYTGVTRAKEELYIICEPDTFVKGINSQRIKGNTLEQKAEYFKGKLDQDGGY